MEKLIVLYNDELFNYLRNNLVSKSKNNIKSLLKNECVYVNNKLVTKYNYIVNKNDVIVIGKNIKKDNFNLKIIYEDNDIIVVDKPTKILTISNDKEKIVTAYRMVSDYVKRKRMGSFIFVVHRLDQDTSGILLFCKNEKIRYNIRR